jgi:predicted site-specific integrase-resolvase
MGLVGYARVSSREERLVLDRQVDALRATSCERIYDA